MFKSKNEKMLFTVAISLGLVLGGSFLYQKLGGIWEAMSGDLDSMMSQIDTLLTVQEQKIEINKRYDEMQNELIVEGEDTVQELKIRKDLTSIFEQVGLQVQRIQPNQQHKKEEDFKIISYNIDDVECTPKQLGELLYLIEQKSEVMEVEMCRIDNQVQDFGRPIGQLRRSGVNPIATGGMLTVDLEISRLIEYRPGEQPDNKRRS